MRLVVVQAVILVVWWFWQARGVDWLSGEGLGNLLLQWGGSMGLLAALNGWFLRRLKPSGRLEPGQTMADEVRSVEDRS